MPGPLKTLVLALFSVAAVGGLALALFRTGETAMQTYLHVDEVTAAPQKWVEKSLEMHGFVRPGSVEKRLDRDHQRMEYKFAEVNCGQAVEVHYAGSVPDTFKDGAEVVTKGKLYADRFEATEIMAKCPSKYQMTQQAQTLCSQGKGN